MLKKNQAAGRHQCSYLIEQQVSEFLQQGGDERWLQGLHCIPTKLRDLYEVNKILAHRPWLITKNHIEVRNMFVTHTQKKGEALKGSLFSF